MAYLQLAEQDYTMLAAANYDKYVFIPEGYRGAAKDTYVREDLFDDMPDALYNQLMFELEQFNQVGLSGKGDRKARRDARNKAKADRKAGRGAGARREAKQKRLETRQAAKKERAEMRQAGRSERAELTGGIGGILGKVGDIAGNILGTKSVDVSAGDSGFSLDVANEEQTFFQQYKWPILIGGGLLLGFGAYTLIKNK